MAFVKKTQTVQKISGVAGNAFLLPVKRCLSHLLLLLFIFVSLNPALAAMSTNEMDMSSPPCAASVDLNCVTGTQSSPLDMQAETSDMGHMMSMAMSEGDDCQSDCNCCPGLCSAYLPAAISSAAFPPANSALPAPAFKRKVSVSASLFRPPISH